MVSVTLNEIHDDKLCLDFLQFVIFPNFSKGSLHFTRISGDHTDIEAQSS